MSEPWEFGLETAWNCACRQDIRMKKENGFSLIELLIVVAIILIIVAIAIPNLLKSRQAANQASAVASLRSISSAEVTYASTYNTGYSLTLSALDGSGPAGPTAAGLIDSILGGTGDASEKSSYNFYYVPCPATPGPNDGTMAPGTCTTVSTYQTSGNPVTGLAGGGTFYFSDASGVIRQKTNNYAGPTDPPLAG